jgi:hypothetical protein
MLFLTWSSLKDGTGKTCQIPIWNRSFWIHNMGTNPIRTRKILAHVNGDRSGLPKVQLLKNATCLSTINRNKRQKYPGTGAKAKGREIFVSFIMKTEILPNETPINLVRKFTRMLKGFMYDSYSG